MFLKQLCFCIIILEKYLRSMKQLLERSLLAVYSLHLRATMIQIWTILSTNSRQTINFLCNFSCSFFAQSKPHAVIVRVGQHYICWCVNANRRTSIVLQLRQTFCRRLCTRTYAPNYSYKYVYVLLYSKLQLRCGYIYGAWRVAYRKWIRSS